jgi:hypothetical protein
MKQQVNSLIGKLIHEPTSLINESTSSLSSGCGYASLASVTGSLIKPVNLAY